MAGSDSSFDRADDLAFALRLSELATEIALPLFERGVDTIVKDDGTPVSEADLTVDREVVAMLRRERPDDGVLSEESGFTAGASSGVSPDGSILSGRRWIIDPIDGTFNFVVGHAAWGTHVALEEDGEIVAGVITRPSYGQRWYASGGAGAWRSATDGGAVEQVSVSAVSSLADARVTAWTNVPWAVMRKLNKECTFVEATLDSALEVVQGDIDAAVGVGGAIWDQAPAVVLLREAGGTFDDGSGGRRPDLGNARYGNGVLDAAVSALLEA